MMDVVDRVNAAIEESGLKKNAIAERIGVSDQTLSAMLCRKRKITADDFYNLCIVLRKEPNELYGFHSINA